MHAFLYYLFHNVLLVSFFFMCVVKQSDVLTTDWIWWSDGLVDGLTNKYAKNIDLKMEIWKEHWTEQCRELNQTGIFPGMFLWGQHFIQVCIQHMQVAVVQFYEVKDRGSKSNNSRWESK